MSSFINTRRTGLTILVSNIRDGGTNERMGLTGGVILYKGASHSILHQSFNYIKIPLFNTIKVTEEELTRRLYCDYVLAYRIYYIITSIPMYEYYIITFIMYYIITFITLWDSLHY